MATDQDSGESSETTTAAPKRKKLLDRAWEALWAAGFEEAAAGRYRTWMLDYIVVHGKRHPREMGVPEVRAFLADDRFSGAAAPQRVEAAAAIRFLYEVVLGFGGGGAGGSGSAAGPGASGASAAWVGGTSLVFGLVVLSVAASLFCRRDF